ncbi:MAG: hypothetical protein ACOX7F_06230 [Eubacteriales bacterium]
MKQIILSHDDKAQIYLVPDPVAEHLSQYCEEFSVHWIWENPHGHKLLKDINGMKIAMYTSWDFIEYLNKWVFPHQPSSLVQQLDWYSYELPEKYADYPQYNF